MSYDISDDRVRTRFSRFLSKFGHRLQYSVFQIRNSGRILNNITTEIESSFSKQFTQNDSIIIFILSKNCKIMRFGYAKNDEDDLIFVG